MNAIKPGDTVYVIATCADAWKRGSGTCWFYENGNCPFQQSGRLEHCGDSENVLDVFETKVEYTELNCAVLQGITFGFAGICESVRKPYIISRVFTNRPDAIAALERMERERERKRQEREQARLVLAGQCGMFAEA